MISSIVILIIGFIALFFVNYRADNIWAYIAPLFIIAGYIIFGWYLYKIDQEAGNEED